MYLKIKNLKTVNKSLESLLNSYSFYKFVIMTLSEYICELLYRYNCVIIPDFGAFLTQRIPATMSKEVQLFYPPQKRISFNNQIVNNDGLLANYIAKQFVQEINEELNSKGRISFSEIGFFTINHEQNLTFEPLHTTNYLTESFGLAPFKTTEIVRTDKTAAISENAAVITPETKVIPQKNNYILKYAAVGVLLLGISGVGLKSYNNSQYLQADEVVNNYLQNASFVFNVEEALPSINIELKKPESSIDYHVIAGAFREYKNATKKLKQLHKKGFNAEYIGKNKYGLHQITYDSFSNENDAINALNRLKRNENPAAWLLTIKK